MTTEKFIKKLIRRVIIISIILFCLVTFLNASNAIIGNYVALGQMENSDILFLIMEMYNNFLKPTTIAIIVGSTFYSIILTVCDVYKFIKIKTKEKNENEEN